MTYPLDFPTVVAGAKINLRGRNVVGMSAAPMSGSQQVNDFLGKWWLGEITWPTMQRDKADVCLAFLDELNGIAGTFTMEHPKRRRPKGAANDTLGLPKVDGAGQTGNTLDIKTGLGDVSGYLLAGDMLQIGDGLTTRLHRAGADVDLVGGFGTVRLWPRLRTSPADSATLTLISPRGLFRLAINELGDETDEAGLVRIPPVPFVEAL